MIYPFSSDIRRSFARTGPYASRLILSIAVLMLALVSWPSTSRAQYPTRPIRIVVPLAAGGSADVIARVVAERLSSVLKQPVLVENRPGAGGATGAGVVAHAAPDGYTLLMATSSTVTLPLFSKSITFRLEHDLEPISLLFKSPLYLVANSAVPATSLGQLVELSKQKGQAFYFATTGLGAARLWLEHFNRNNSVAWKNITYSGGGPAILALQAKEVQLMAGTYENYRSLFDSGDLRALAVLTGKRSQDLPNVPTAEELGFSSLDVTFWVGLLAPLNTPKEILARLGEAASVVVNSEDVVRRLSALGIERVGSTPQDFSAYIRETSSRLAAAAREAGIEPE